MQNYMQDPVKDAPYVKCMLAIAVMAIICSLVLNAIDLFRSELSAAHAMQEFSLPLGILALLGWMLLPESRAGWRKILIAVSYVFLAAFIWVTLRHLLGGAA